MYIWLECPLCGGPYVLMARFVHDGEPLLAKDFLRSDLTPYTDDLTDPPPCMTCGEIAFMPLEELIRTGDELPRSRG